MILNLPCQVHLHDQEVQTKMIQLCESETQTHEQRSAEVRNFSEKEKIWEEILQDEEIFEAICLRKSHCIKKLFNV